MTDLSAKTRWRAVRQLISPNRPMGPEVDELLGAPWFDERLRALADELGQDPTAVRQEAIGYLREMAATHEPHATNAWRGFGRWFLRAYDLYVDDDQVDRLRELDRKSSLAFAFSHRSYLDGFVVPEVIAAKRLTPVFTLGGSNLNLFPFGAWASRSGVVFIRRNIRELPVYRLALRSYIAELVRNRGNLAWSIEGGRTRTGKLRPPTFGILRYLVDGLDEATRTADPSMPVSAGADINLIGVSIVYDQLHEVPLMTKEARGAGKRPEDLRWLVHLARQQRERLGRAYLDFGEPIPLNQRLAELRADPATGRHEVELIALDVSHRINRATQVTATAVISLALLGADRSLTLEELLSTVRPLAGYLNRQGWAVAGAQDLTDRSTIRRTLQEMAASHLVTAYDEGTEPVWQIAPGKHLVAAFYRNTIIHALVQRAITELALQAVAEDDQRRVVEEARRLRTLLKFEFYFPASGQFGNEVLAELRHLGMNAPDEAWRCGSDEAAAVLSKADLLVAHLVLRPYLDAYLVVADRLAAEPPDPAPVDQERLLAACLAVGQQWILQHRITSAESVSLELFRTALRVAGKRQLLIGDADPAKRQEFIDEVAADVRRADAIAELARKGQP
ncbi:MAG TPA: lysophospholipid acyltransferase [Nakamurella sp.]